MLGKLLVDTLLKRLENIDYGQFDVELPDGRKFTFKGKQAGAHGTIYVTDWRTVFSSAKRGSVGFSEAYRDGWWHTDNLPNLLLWALENETSLQGYYSGGRFFSLLSQLSYFFKRNNMAGSKRNIHAHYDLGNDFYQLWLDKGMSYSSGLYKNDSETLEQAQDNKYDRILDCLNSQSGDLLEIGCGWGGMLERAIGKGDYNVKGITISEQQYQYAQARLPQPASVCFEDYRLQEGSYDHIISVEMFEAVGEKFWPIYFEKLKFLLKDKGKAVIQTIMIDDKHFEKYRQTGDMIRSYIFPGGMLPSPSRYQQELEKAGLKLVDSFYFRDSYARTLEAWLLKFQQNLPAIQKTGFDEKFIRIWQFYLAMCIAGFKHGRIDVAQTELIHNHR